MQAEHRAAQYKLLQARGRLYPELEVNADIGSQKIDRPNGLGPLVNNRWFNRQQVTVNVRQVLFDGWDRANDIYRSQALITEAEYQILARSEAVALAAVEAYIDVERHLVLLGLSKKNVKRHRQLLGVTQSRIEGGKAPKSDYEQALERLEAANALVAQIEVALGTANAKYKNIIGIKPTKLKAVKAAKGIPRTSRAVFEAALTNNPDIHKLESSSQVAEYEKKQFKSTLFPQIYLEGSATRGEDLDSTPGENNELKASFVLRWKILDGGIRRNRELELAEKASEKRFQQEIFVRDLKREIEIAWSRYTSGSNELAALRNQVKQNQLVVNSYQDEYDAGKRTLLDVLDAESSKFASEFQLYNSRALNLFSGYQLLGNMGLLLEKLGIADPTYTSSYDEPGLGMRPVTLNGGLTIPSLR